VEQFDFVIVGAGITGLSAAWRLAASGRDVAVLERFALGHDRGSSHGATRIFRFAYPDAVYVRMAQAALPLWRELESASGTEILRVTGGLDIGPREAIDAIDHALASSGARSERIDHAAVRRRFPWLAAPEGDALHSPDTGVIAAARALDAMASVARAAGANVREQRAVRSLTIDGDSVVVDVDPEPVRAHRCVVASGAWAEPLLAPLGLAFPARVTREQVFYFRGPDEVLPFIHYGGVARYSVPGFAGAAGVKVAEHHTGEQTSADGRSFAMDPEGAARVAAYVERTLPGLDPEPVAFETCLYTTTPDEGFVLDIAGPIVLASACSGHGFKFGPILGEAIAALATGREPPVPLHAFARSRF
jgi:monomeric sarcosine oxidase